MTTTTPAPTRQALRASSILRAGALTGVAAALANLAIWGIARAADVDLLVQPPGTAVPEPVPAAAVIVASVVPTLLGAFVLGLLRARLAGAERAWRVFVAVATVLSFPPLFDGNLTGGTRASLGMMHVVVAGLAVTLLPRLHR